MASLADALEYQHKQKRTLSDLLDDISYGAGEGISENLQGLGQMVMHPIDTARQVYGGVKAAVQNPQAAYQAAKQGVTEAMSSPQAAARFIGQNFSPVELANGLSNVGKMREMTVYHGTPHKFDAFDASKIGTGEGAQAYGHGIYVAESPNVAGSYATQLGGKDADLINNAIGRTIHINGGDSSRIRDNLITEGFPQEKITPEIERSIKRIIENTDSSGSPNSTAIREYGVLKNMVPDKGHLLTVDLPDSHIDRMLDWDKPLSEQPEALGVLKDNEHLLDAVAKSEAQRLALNESNPARLNHPLLGKIAAKQKTLDAITGSQVIEQLSQRLGGQDKVSAYLRSLGIPGIKYLDAGSRPQSIADNLMNSLMTKFKGDKNAVADAMALRHRPQDRERMKEKYLNDLNGITRNFVVFPGEEHNLKILDRK